MLSLTDPITNIPLIGPNYADKLHKLNIHTVGDLLHHYPIRYLDRSQFTIIQDLKDGEIATIIAEVLDFKNIYTKFGKNLQQAKVADATGQIQITWFNQSFLSRTIREGEWYAFSGRVKDYHGRLTLQAPEHERVDENSLSGWQRQGDPQKLPAGKEKFNQNTKSGSPADAIFGGVSLTGPAGSQLLPSLHTGRLVAVYPETAGVSSKWLRSRIKATLDTADITDHLAPATIQRYSLKPLSYSLTQIHFPESQDTLTLARHRLAFDELFFLQLEGTHKRHLLKQKQVSRLIQLHHQEIRHFIDSLPFKLTRAQHRATGQILEDLEKGSPMNRLLEGDVGSGKTVVAAIAAYATHLSGLKSLFMAPTEILANQHYRELTKLFAATNLSIGLRTGATKQIGEFDLTIGTHALLFDKNLSGSQAPARPPKPKAKEEEPPNNLGLIIIDEQHRFGVAQRAKLESLGDNPHRLTMSATPIPRTIALTLYGDLDVSIIDELPHGRERIKTWVVPSAKRTGAYRWIRDQIATQTAQVFVVCPLIDPSETDKLKEVKSARQEYDKLTKIFPDFKIGLIHGRLKSAEKNRAITDFKTRITQILVATPVIEVGIDIPQAAVIVIEAAERFGLAQLHQLRGRVGRGDTQSYCLLFTSTDTQTVSHRLTAMTRYHSGFKLAEIDLKIRGPGEVFGVMQHGFDALKLARLSNIKLIETTKEAATNIISTDPNLDHYPQLKVKLNLDTSPRTTLN